MDLGEPGVTPQMMDSPPQVRDINSLEFSLLVPLALAVIVLGVASPIITRSIEPEIHAIQFPQTMTEHLSNQNQVTWNLANPADGVPAAAQ